jgi:hypothetical protein
MKDKHREKKSKPEDSRRIQKVKHERKEKWTKETNQARAKPTGRYCRDVETFQQGLRGTKTSEGKRKAATKVSEREQGRENDRQRSQKGSTF